MSAAGLLDLEKLLFDGHLPRVMAQNSCCRSMYMRHRERAVPLLSPSRTMRYLWKIFGNAYTESRTFVRETDHDRVWCVCNPPSPILLQQLN